MAIIITENTTWSGNIVLNQSYQVAPGVTLTITPGTKLTRALNNSSPIQYGIEVFGTLNALGTAENKITFDGWSPMLAFNNQGSLIFNNVNFIGAGSIGGGTGGKLVVTNSYLDNSGIVAWSNLDGSEISNNIFNSSSINIYSQGINFKISDNSFYSETNTKFIRITYGGDLFPIVGNNFYGENSIAIYNENKNDINAKGNWFNTSNKNEIDGKIFDYYDNLNYGKVDYSGYLLAPNLKAPLQIVNTSEKHTLSVLVNAGILGKSPVFLENLVEDLIKVGGVIKTHTVTYGSSTYNYNAIDELITTVVRDGDFTSEFRKEIAELSPSASSITYPDLVSLVGKLNVDSTIQYIAGADGNYVG